MIMTKDVYTLDEWALEMKMNVKKYAKEMREEFTKREENITV